jgi:hypothetical protein
VGVSVVKGYGSLLSLNASVVDNVVQLATISGATPTLLGSNQATATPWPLNTPVNAAYGGALNTMGISAATITPAMVNNSNFGVAISANVITAPFQLSLLITAAIDQVTMTVYTTPSAIAIPMPMLLPAPIITG